jgi:hypothetical protein
MNALKLHSTPSNADTHCLQLILERNSNKDPTRGFSVTHASVGTKKENFEGGTKDLSDLGAALAQKTERFPSNTLAFSVIVLCGRIMQVIPLRVDNVPDQSTDDDFDDWEAVFKREILG